MELVSPEPPLTDGAILLRPPTDADVAAITAACQDSEIARFTRIPSPYGEDDARAFVRLSQEEAQRGAGINFCVVDARTDELLGAIGLMTDGWPVAESGYWVVREARSRGIARRALRLISRWALVDLGVARLELITHPQNIASQQVAEHAGFRQEGLLRQRAVIGGQRTDCVMYSLLPSDLDVSGRAEGFEFTVRRGAVAITHRGRKAAVLRGAAAQRFLVDIEAGDLQGVMARATGNFKRGNERQARSHPRNRADR